MDKKWHHIPIQSGDVMPYFDLIFELRICG